MQRMARRSCVLNGVSPWRYGAGAVALDEAGGVLARPSWVGPCVRTEHTQQNEFSSEIQNHFFKDKFLTKH